MKVLLHRNIDVFINLTAKNSISTATFLLTYLFLSTKPWCKLYFSDDKFKDSDDKFKRRTLYLSLGNLLNLIFSLVFYYCTSCGFPFVSSTEPEKGHLCSTLFKRSSPNFAYNFKQI